MKKVLTSCVLLALAGCASSNTVSETAPQVTARADYQLPSVYFDFNSVALSNGAKSTLAQAMQQVSKDDDLELVITGYADMYGNEAVNKRVSQQRAQSVKEYLRTLSVPADKMQVEAKGKSELRTTDPDAQDGERRVEVKVIGGAPAGAAAGQATQQSATKAQSQTDSSQPWYSVLFDCMCEK